MYKEANIWLKAQAEYLKRKKVIIDKSVAKVDTEAKKIFSHLKK